jgi:hypothetical protein
VAKAAKLFEANASPVPLLTDPSTFSRAAVAADKMETVGGAASLMFVEKREISNTKRETKEILIDWLRHRRAPTHNIK